MKALRSLFALSALAVAAISFGVVASVTLGHNSNLNRGMGGTKKTFVAERHGVQQATPHPTKMNITGSLYQASTVSVLIGLNAPPKADLALNLSATPGLTFVGGNSVTIPANQRTITVDLQISPTCPILGNMIGVTVAATGDSFSRDFKLFGLDIASLTADTTTLAAGESTTGHVTMNVTVSQNVTLTASGSEFLTAGPVTIPAGSNSADFTITAGAPKVRHTNQLVRLTTPAGRSKAIAFIIDPM